MKNLASIRTNVLIIDTNLSRWRQVVYKHNEIGQASSIDMENFLTAGRPCSYGVSSRLHE